jgi:hypothetical protein
LRGQVVPIQLASEALGLLARQEIPHEFQVFERNHGGQVFTVTADDHWLAVLGNLAEHRGIAGRELRLVDMCWLWH